MQVKKYTDIPYKNSWSVYKVTVSLNATEKQLFYIYVSEKCR